MGTIEVSRIRTDTCDHIYTASVPQGIDKERIEKALNRKRAQPCPDCINKVMVR